MISAEQRTAQIIEDCGFIKNFLIEMDINDDIRELEEFARAHRPPTASKTEPLSKFLPPEQAKKLEELRKEKLRLKDVEERVLNCAKDRIKKEGITLVRTDKGTFAISKQPVRKKPKNAEEVTGLAVLFE